jgi:hypothetical protein
MRAPCDFGRDDEESPASGDSPPSALAGAFQAKFASWRRTPAVVEPLHFLKTWCLSKKVINHHQTVPPPSLLLFRAGKGMAARSSGFVRCKRANRQYYKAFRKTTAAHEPVSKRNQLTVPSSGFRPLMPLSFKSLQAERLCLSGVLLIKALLAINCAHMVEAPMHWSK